MPEVGIAAGGGILVGKGQIQSVSAGQLEFKHIPFIQVSPLAQSVVLVQLRLQDCKEPVGAGVADGVIGATAHKVVEPGAVAISLNRTMANVPEPLLAVVFVPVTIIVPVVSSVYVTESKKLPLVRETNCKYSVS